MPEDLRELRDVLGARRYGSRYCSDSGVVRKDARLVTEENIDPARLSNPHIRFYAESNPGYVNGDGLIQLTPLGVKEFVRAGVSAGRTLLRSRP